MILNTGEIIELEGTCKKFAGRVDGNEFPGKN